MTCVSFIVSLSFAFGAYSNTRQALTQWGCARKLYAAITVSMQCTCVRIKMVKRAVMLSIETRMTHVCLTRGFCTHLLGCLFSDIVVCMLRAVAYIDMDSHVEVIKSGRSVHRAMLSMHDTQCKNCFSKKYASYAICMRICALVMGGIALFTDFLWAGSV